MKKSLTISFLFLLFAEFIYNISAYIIKSGLGHNLGVSEYGRYSIVISFTTMLIVLIGRGIPTAMNKRISEYRDNPGKILGIRKTSAKLQLNIILSLTILFFLSSPLIAKIFGDTSLTNLFRLSSLLIPSFALSSFHVSYFNGLKKFKMMTILKSSRGIYRVLFIIIGAFLYGIYGAIAGAILAPFTVYLTAIFLEKVYTKKTTAELIHYESKDILSYAYTFMSFLLFYEFFTRVDLYLIKALLNDDRLTGLYDSAMTLAMIPYYGVFALTFILFPTMSKLTKTNDLEKIKKLILKVSIFLISSLGFSMIVLFFFSDVFMQILFGVEFSEASELIPLMLGGTFFGSFFYIFASILNGAGHTKITSYIVAVALMMSIIANTILIPLYGLTSTAIVFSVTSTLMGISSIFFVHIKFFKK